MKADVIQGEAEDRENAETEIMARLRAHCDRDGGAVIAQQLARLPSGPVATAGNGDRLTRFCQNLERQGASVALAPDRAAAVEQISRFVVARHNHRRVVAGHDPRLAALPWRDGGLLPRFGSANADDAVSVAYAQDGIAETGSVVLWLERRNPALNNVLVDDQIVLVDREQIHEMLEDLWRHEALRSPSGPRGLMIISGPSSTADIGLHLVQGAHGPRALHVIVVGPA